MFINKLLENKIKQESINFEGDQVWKKNELRCYEVKLFSLAFFSSLRI